MLRVARNTRPRVRHAVYDAAGAAAGDLTVTVTATSALTGDAVFTSAAATEDGTTVGLYYLDLPIAATANLDVLELAWSYTLASASQTERFSVEVVGAHLCDLLTIDDALARGGTATSYSARRKELARSVAETVFEDACSYGAFSPRRAAYRFSGEGSARFKLPAAHVRSLVSLTVDGEDLDADELADIYVTDHGTVHLASALPAGRGNVTAIYEHGLDGPPVDVQRAVAQLAAAMLANGPWDDRGFAASDDGGFIRLLTAGVAGAMFSIPEVEATAKRYRGVHVA